MAFIWMVASRSIPKRQMTGTWLMVAFGAISVLSAVVNGGVIDRSMSWFLSILMLVLASNIVFDYLLHAKSFEPFYWAIALGTTIVSLLMLLPLGVDFLDLYQRRSLVGMGENGMGATLATGALCHLVLLTRRPLRFLGWALTHAFGAAICMVGMVITGSRGAEVAFMVGLIIFGISKFRARFNWPTAAMVIAVAGLLIWLQFTIPIARMRWEETLSGIGGSGNATSDRMTIIEIAIPMFLERPFLGWSIGPAMQEIKGRGFGGFGDEMDTHNSLVWILLDAGLLGFLPFIIVIFRALRASIKAMKGPEGSAPAALLGLILVFSMSVTWHYRKPLWLFIPLAFAAAARSVREGVVTCPPAVSGLDGTNPNTL